jgi:hypothetical protein
MKYKSTLLIACVLSLTTVNAENFAISPCQNGKCYIGEGDEKVLKTIENLDKAVQKTTKIQDAELREAISNHLMSCSRCLKQEFFYKNEENIEKAITTLYENLDEILSDCDDIQVREEIRSCINEVLQEFDSL